MARRKFKVLIKIGDFKKIFSVEASSPEKAVDLAQIRAMKELPKTVLAATCFGAKTTVKVVAGK